MGELTQCQLCFRELGDNYPETRIFCNEDHLQAYLHKYFQDTVDEYINEHIYEIVRENREVAIEVLKP